MALDKQKKLIAWAHLERFCFNWSPVESRHWYFFFFFFKSPLIILMLSQGWELLIWTLNFWLYNIFSISDLLDGKSLVKNATSNYNTDPTGKIRFRTFHVVPRIGLQQQSSIVGYFIFVRYPQKKHLGETCFLTSIAQTRENDLFAILPLPNHEHSLFLNLFRSFIS